MTILSRAVRSLKALKAGITDSERLARRVARIDWSEFAEAIARSGDDGCGDVGHVLLASTGIQNTGDQAMLNAFLAAVDGPVTVVVQPESTYSFARSHGDVRVEVIPELFLGGSEHHRRALRRLAELVRSGRSFSVVGADIIDGGYHRRLASTLWAIAGASADAGIDTRVIGFSWNASVSGAVRQIASKATAAGVVACVRDPRSADRAERDGLVGVQRVADSVFTLPQPSLDVASRARLALMNISGLLRSRLDLSQEYIEIVRWLVGAGYDVLLVPHVNNPSGSDVRAITEFYDLLPQELRSRVRTQETLLPPEDVQRLAATAEIVVTGRMHLAILASTVGTPAIVVATQGKVEGLMDLLGLPGWGVEPGEGLGASVIRVLKQYDEDSASVRQQLAIGVDAARALAMQNFVGLVESGAR